MIGMIQSVLGPVDPTTVGPCLIHEHLVIDYGELVGTHKEVPEAGSALEIRTRMMFTRAPVSMAIE